MTPGIIPIDSDPEPPARCPKCDKLEETKLVCAHCGYEYETEDDEPPSLRQWMIVLAAIIFAVYLLCTAAYWLKNANYLSLADILREQFEWAKEFQVFGTKKDGRYFG